MPSISEVIRVKPRLSWAVRTAALAVCTVAFAASTPALAATIEAFAVSTPASAALMFALAARLDWTALSSSSSVIAFSNRFLFGERDVTVHVVLGLTLIRLGLCELRLCL